tara:strand:- start:17929 stop:18936 length:1008 start_codon:yes stop_codon:yes gene_type:complete
MKNKKITLITNEGLTINKNEIFCQNIITKILCEELSSYCQISIIGKKYKSNLKINHKNLNVLNNFFSSIYKILFNNKDNKYLVLSITPYTFFYMLLLKITNSDTYLYLRSDGFKEYTFKYYFLGFYLYKFFFLISTYKTKIISCNKNLSNGKEYFKVTPSIINNKWLNHRKINKISTKIKLLYVGRFRIEKGIYSLLNLIKELNLDFILSLVGDDNKNMMKNKNIINYGIIDNENQLIKMYDMSDIIILPSYTESYSKVIDESLSRGKPVIIFDEIKEIILNRIGVFAIKRNSKDLNNKIIYIKNNYEKITKQILNQKIPNKKDFIMQLTSHIIL